MEFDKTVEKILKEQNSGEELTESWGKNIATGAKWLGKTALNIAELPIRLDNKAQQLAGKIKSWAGPHGTIDREKYKPEKAEYQSANGKQVQYISIKNTSDDRIDGILDRYLRDENLYAKDTKGNMFRVLSKMVKDSKGMCKVNNGSVNLDIPCNSFYYSK